MTYDNKILDWSLACLGSDSVELLYNTKYHRLACSGCVDVDEVALGTGMCDIIALRWCVVSPLTH